MMKNNVFNRLSIILSCNLILLSSFSAQAEDSLPENNTENQQINPNGPKIPQDPTTAICPSPGGVLTPGPTHC